jgi:hypothetical protein
MSSRRASAKEAAVPSVRSSFSSDLRPLAVRLISGAIRAFSDSISERVS